MTLSSARKFLFFSVCMILAAVGAADALSVPASGISSVTSQSVTVTDTINASATASAKPWFAWDPFSTFAITLCFSIAALSGAALFWNAWKAGKSLRFSFTIGVVTFVLVLMLILLILGPLSQVIIPSLRAWESGSWEDAITLLLFIAILIILTVVLVWLLSRIPRKERLAIPPLADMNLEDEFKNLGNPLQILLQEAEHKAIEILARWKSDSTALRQLELTVAIQTFVNSELKNFDDFYREKQRTFAGYSTAVAAPLTTDNDLNKKLWGAIEAARIR